jgi:hypothetical protein
MRLEELGQLKRTPHQDSNLQPSGLWHSPLLHAGSIPDEVIGIFSSSNPSSRTVVLGSTQFLTEMSIRNLPGVKGQPVHKADNLTAICRPVV